MVVFRGSEGKSSPLSIACSSSAVKITMRIDVGVPARITIGTFPQRDETARRTLRFNFIVLLTDYLRLPRFSLFFFLLLTNERFDNDSNETGPIKPISGTAEEGTGRR